MVSRGVSLVLLVASCSAMITFSRLAGGQEPPAAEEGPEVTGVRKTGDEFKRAFDAGDAKAVAALWTIGGEVTEADGNQIIGREMIEETYAGFFKDNPKATIEIAIESIRVLGPNVAIESGTTKVTRADRTSSMGNYSALHVRGPDGWHMASVTEFPAGPSDGPTLKDVGWLVGEWEMSAGERKATVSYTWDHKKAFLRGHYTVEDGDEVVSSGTEMIARDPLGGLRSWRFDDGGAFAESAWTREEKTWLIETVGTLKDGGDATAQAIMTPLDKDSFLWQAVQRTINGEPLPVSAPLKVRRAAQVTGSATSKPSR